MLSDNTDHSKDRLFRRFLQFAGNNELVEDLFTEHVRRER